MIATDFEQKLDDAEEHAPKRLARKDVADIRTLFAAAKGACPNKCWYATRTFWLSREKGLRAAARLGRPTPCVVVLAEWRKTRARTSVHDQPTSLAITVTAHTVLGAPDNFKIRVGKHLFRSTVSCGQFAREISHLVRLGFGWVKYQDWRMANR